MILDYLFFRVYKAYCKYPKEGDPLKRSRGCLLTLLHIVILPIALNLAALYGKPYRITNVIPYVLITFVSYKFVCNRYSEKKVKTLSKKYKKANGFAIPMFFIWILVVISAWIGMLLTVLLNYYVMRPLGLIGCI